MRFVKIYISCRGIRLKSYNENAGIGIEQKLNMKQTYQETNDKIKIQSTHS